MKTIVTALILMSLTFGCLTIGAKYLQTKVLESVENSQIMKFL